MNTVFNIELKDSPRVLHKTKVAKLLVTLDFS